MTLVELRYLVALAVERHFGRAARAVHVSQPTLSAAIKNLEDELGVALVLRGGGGVRLTPAGERVVAQARRVLDEATKVTAAARNRASLAGKLRLGAIATLAPYAITPLLLPLLHAHPELDLVLREGLTDELLGLLKLGELDGVLLALPVGTSGVAVEPIFEEPFAALVPARSPLAKKRRVTAADLASERLILLTEGHCFRDQALAVCHGHLALEDPERDALAATSLHTIWRMVEANMGATLVPRLAADDIARASRTVHVKPFASPVPSRTIGIAWRTGSAAADDARALASFLRGHLPEQLEPVFPGAPPAEQAAPRARAR
jgi:LysR family transcriptional regulator, hydrogen peroxide-inducible genes activator